MKYCSHCGKELIDEAEYCPNCGCKVANTSNNSSDKLFKGKGLGFILSFFLGLLGLILAIVLGDEDCKQMAIKTFIITAIASVALVVLYFVLIFGVASCATLGGLPLTAI